MKKTRDVNGRAVLTGMVLEKQDKHLTIPETCNVFYDTDRTTPLGTATLYKTDAAIMAGLVVAEIRGFDTFYPTIIYVVDKSVHDEKTGITTILEGRVVGVSLTLSPNLDPSIGSIGDQLKTS
ncbi:hypothetical protein [Fibrella forsythiae]|uniref:Uncharacterized protein n=1 Tax=Fibrella forsythiae TaxID=2817061 RepID=A0ABS3JDK7_9BACT|nr:hypothetical protein [Fibrella forsythiae]MBO0947533.1 hypothetical protein [Fibrella forsythiae]